jgi:hypothetical protein
MSNKFLTLYLDRNGYRNIPSKTITATIRDEEYNFLIPISENNIDDKRHRKLAVGIIAYRINKGDKPNKPRNVKRAPYLNRKNYSNYSNVMDDLICLITARGYTVSRNKETMDRESQTDQS